MPMPELSSVEAPVLLQRQGLASGKSADDKSSPLELTGPKVLEATCLRGRELRWQPWPEVTKFNEEWKATPLRWGLRGELFVLLQQRESGDARVCAAEVHLPVEKWTVLKTLPALSPPATKTRYKSFTFNEHLFLISITRESGSFKVYHIPDPSSAWDVAFETTLPDTAAAGKEGQLPISRFAKLCVFYAKDSVPHVVAVEHKADSESTGARLFRISDPGKPWITCTTTLPLSSKVRLLPVYTKSRGGSIGDFEVSIFSVDAGSNEISILHVPAETDKPWTHVSKLPFAGDTRLSCIYVPGKPEPLLMAGSPTERMQKLCHLNLIEWCAAKQDDRMTPPKAPVVEEKFSRQMASLWPDGTGREGQAVALPIDCTVDLPVSRHLWVTLPIAHGGDLVPVAGPRGGPPDMMRPPFDYGPFGHPPFDPRGPPLPFDMRPPPPFARPPFDELRPPPFDCFMGGKGFDPHRHPAFDRPPFDRPPLWFDGGHRPPLQPPFGDGCRPPLDGRDRRAPLDRPPFDDRRPPVDGMPPPGPGIRPPFEAPPGDWFSGVRPPFDALRDADHRPVGPPVLLPIEVGSVVDANFREQGQFLRAKVLAKHEDGTFDLEYDGDYIDWHVPMSRIRPPPHLMPPGPWGAPPPLEGAPMGREGERRHKRRHRHRTSDGNPGNAAEGEGGERKRRRHHRCRGEGEEGADRDRKRRRRHRQEGEAHEGDGRGSSASPPEGFGSAPVLTPAATPAAAMGPCTTALAPEGGGAAAADDPSSCQGGDHGVPAGGSPGASHRKRHRHHRHRDPEKAKRSRSHDGERKRHRKRRHRSSDGAHGGGAEASGPPAEAPSEAGGTS